MVEGLGLAWTVFESSGVQLFEALSNGRSSARTDYHDRSGFPKGLQAARGAARSFEAPRDFRTPDALRPRSQQQRESRETAASTPAASS
jgi:hypothetical protein